MSNMPMTREAIDQRRGFINSELNRIQKNVDTIKCFGAVCFHWSDLSHQLEKHIGYFEEYLDAYHWFDDYKDVHNKFDIPATYYILSANRPVYEY